MVSVSSEAVLAALKGRGKGGFKGGRQKGGKGKMDCWECGGPHRRSECEAWTKKMEMNRAKGGTKGKGLIH